MENEAMLYGYLSNALQRWMVYSADNRGGSKNDSDPNNLTSIMDTASKSDSKLVNEIQDSKSGYVMT